MVSGGADSAVALQCALCDELVGFVDPPLSHCDFSVTGGKPFGNAPGSLVKDVSAGLYIHPHIGAVVLDDLEAADRLAVLYPLLYISEGHIHGCLFAADHLSAFGYGGLLQCLGQDVPASMEFAQHVLLGDFYIIENNFAELVGADSWHDLALYALAFGIYYKQGDAVFRSVPFPSSGGADDVVGYVGVLHKEFGAVYDEGVAVCFRFCVHASGIISCTGLGESQGHNKLAFGYLGGEG